jgi:hypothetical protein
MSQIKLLAANPLWIHNYLIKKKTIFKIAKLTLEMYCGLHFQFQGAHYHS